MPPLPRSFAGGSRPAKICAERPEREPGSLPRSGLCGALNKNACGKAVACENKRSPGSKPYIRASPSSFTSPPCNSIAVFTRWAAGTKPAEKSHASIWPHYQCELRTVDHFTPFYNAFQFRKTVFFSRGLTLAVLPRAYRWGTVTRCCSCPALQGEKSSRKVAFHLRGRAFPGVHEVGHAALKCGPWGNGIGGEDSSGVSWIKLTSIVDPRTLQQLARITGMRTHQLLHACARVVLLQKNDSQAGKVGLI